MIQAKKEKTGAAPRGSVAIDLPPVAKKRPLQPVGRPPANLEEGKG